MSQDLVLDGLAGFLIFTADVFLLMIGHRFFFSRGEGASKRRAWVPILALTGKFVLLGGGVYWAVAVAHLNILAFVSGAGLVLVVWSSFLLLARVFRQ